MTGFRLEVFVSSVTNRFSVAAAHGLRIRTVGLAELHRCPDFRIQDVLAPIRYTEPGSSDTACDVRVSAPMGMMGITPGVPGQLVLLAW